MKEAAQKTFLDARQRFTTAKSAFYGLRSRIGSVNEAMIQGASYSSNGWYSMTVLGRPVSYKSSRNVHQFDASQWPTAEQITAAWIEVNQAYADYVQAFKQLGDDDRSYLGVSGYSEPEP